MKDKKYLSWVARRGCLVCGIGANVHHIHCGQFGGRITRTDSLVVPLCKYHHQDQKMGIHGDLFIDKDGPLRVSANERFLKIYGIDLYLEAERLRRDYESERETSGG
jgi:hypothetical protein